MLEYFSAVVVSFLILQAPFCLSRCLIYLIKTFLNVLKHSRRLLKLYFSVQGNVYRIF